MLHAYMAEDVDSTCFNSSSTASTSILTCTNTTATGTLFLNPTMTLGNSCLYTTANLSGSFLEGTVLQILPDSTLLAVPSLKEPAIEPPATIILKDSGFLQDLIEIPQAQSLLVESSHPAPVTECSETNISDLDLSFLNEADDINSSKALTGNATKDLQGLQSLDSSELLAKALQDHMTSSMNSAYNTGSMKGDKQKECNSMLPEKTTEDTVMIDVSKPIQLSQNSLIMVNGQKCVLQQDLETGQVIAYPVKEPEKPRRRRGRPRKSSLEQTEKETSKNLDLSPELPESVDTISENEREEGLLDIVNDDGSLVRRSSRKRKKAKVLKDYETGNLKQELGSDAEETEKSEFDPELNSRRRKSKGPGRPRKFTFPKTGDPAEVSQNDGTKKSRGRPRKHLPTSEPTQAFLVQTADGQTLMMQVPISSLPPGVTLQEVAQNIAQRLNSGLSQSSTTTDFGSSMKNIDQNKEVCVPAALQDHSVGSTTNICFTEKRNDNVENYSNPLPDTTHNDSNVIIDPTSENEISLEGKEVSSSSNFIPQEDNLLPNFSVLGDNHESNSNFSLNFGNSSAAIVSPASKTKTDNLSDNFIQLPKEFLLEGDFIKDKINLQQLLDNVVHQSGMLDNVVHHSGRQNSTVQQSGVLDNVVQQCAMLDNVVYQSGKLDNMVHQSAVLNNSPAISHEVLVQTITEADDITDVEVNHLQSDLNGAKAVDKPCVYLSFNATSSVLENNDTLTHRSILLSSIEHDHDLLVHSAKRMNSDLEKNVEHGFEAVGTPTLTVAANCSGATVVPVSSEETLSADNLPVILSHKDIPGYQKCKICQKFFWDEEEMIKHFKTDHPRCICSQCNYMAEHAYVIKRHAVRHSEKIISCNICGKHYKDHYILKMHIKMVHLPAEVMFTCNLCSKKFTRKAHLKRHMRIHAPDKPYQCSFCSYKGCERSDITKHLLVHEAPKLKCDICGKAFRHMKNKDLHVKRHYKQRDFKCGICNFYGYTFTDIRKHIERRHADSKTTCAHCGLVFKSHADKEEHVSEGVCQTVLKKDHLIECSDAQKESLEEVSLDILEEPEICEETSQSTDTVKKSKAASFVVPSTGSAELSFLSVSGDNNTRVITLVASDRKTFTLDSAEQSEIETFVLPT